MTALQPQKEINFNIININGKFPGHTINSTTNNNVVVDVRNKLDENLLITWLQVANDEEVEGAKYHVGNATGVGLQVQVASSSPEIKVAGSRSHTCCLPLPPNVFSAPGFTVFCTAFFTLRCFKTQCLPPTPPPLRWESDGAPDFVKLCMSAVYVFCLCNLNQHDFNFKSVILQSASIWMSCLNRIKRFNKAQMKFHRKTGFLVALSFCPLVCKAVNVRHHRVGETDEPASYRINDELEYLVEIYEWSGSNWEPYVANDVQVQFYMMSPYVLKTMSTDKKGLYLASFKVTGVARIGIRVDVVKDVCPIIKHILLLDSKGRRVAVKYYTDEWPTNSDKLAFESSSLVKH
ncbi:hypothetical protein L2E82_02478 [Cichorium intybus]|uniref:Uncharacterized protein n=1 Tax=Cichorium intybus TaxID=13427 RepID=A0ACB9H2X4_CICIN|nr:hypothetical protein L2E82_02478 [Cichorium intybus]